MASPQPSEIENRQEYFEDWLLRLSDEEMRKLVVDEETAKDFIREAFDKDSSLSNLREGMDSIESTYEKLISGRVIQELINENTDGVPLKLVKIRTEPSSVLNRRISQRVPQPKIRRQVYTRVFTEDNTAQTGVKVVTDRRGRLSYRNPSTGQFMSNNVLLRRTDQVIRTNPDKKAEIERLIRKEESFQNLQKAK